MRRVVRKASGVAAFLCVAGVAVADASALERGDPVSGKATYEGRCAICHGAEGAGDGPVARTLPDKPSNWTAGGGRLKDLNDQEIYDLIARGGKPFGRSPLMPAHPDLANGDLRNLVAYVRSLARGDHVSVGPAAVGVGRVETLGEGLRWGSALDWAMTLTIGLSGLILTCIVVSRILYSGRQTEGSALWLHLLSLGVFPLSLLVVGNFAVLEYAKEDRFCGACHLTMKPYIDDMRVANGKSLAALHFQHRSAPDTECYSCHANYGVHGTFEAKITGLRDVYRYVTRTYQLPLKMRGPFDNTLCLKCHDGAKRYVAHEIHVRLSEAMRAGQIKCGGCHGPSHDIPKHRLTGSSGQVG
jgi:cytochrome c nitrite reductase small subunit